MGKHNSGKSLKTQMPYSTIALNYRKDGSSVRKHGNTSLLSDEKQAQLANLQYNSNWWSYFGKGLGVFVGFQLVNRVPQVAGQNLYVRGAAVLLSAYMFGRVPGGIYRSGQSKVYNEIMNGLPVWDSAEEAVDLSKRFFFLDDDNNYQPSLFHHGLTKSFAPHEFCRIE